LAISPEALLPAVTSSLPSSQHLALQNTMVSDAYALTLATRHKHAVRMLNWGGGMGHYYLLSRALVPDLEIDYHCKDLPLLAKHGSQLLSSVHFHTDESCLASTYDFVLASGSLHYTEVIVQVAVTTARDI